LGGRVEKRSFEKSFFFLFEKSLDLFSTKKKTQDFFTSFAAPKVKSTFSSSVLLVQFPPPLVVSLTAERSIEVTLGARESSTNDADAGAPRPSNDPTGGGAAPAASATASAAACCASAAASDSAAIRSTYDPSTMVLKSNW